MTHSYIKWGFCNSFYATSIKIEKTQIQITLSKQKCECKKLFFILMVQQFGEYDLYSKESLNKRGMEGLVNQCRLSVIPWSTKPK